jgi:hypothetical protein
MKKLQLKILALLEKVRDKKRLKNTYWQQIPH